MQHYRIFGLHVSSPLVFPELASVADDSARPPDVEISLGKVERHHYDIDETGRGFWAHEGRFCYIWPGTGAFQVSAGRHILVESHEDAVGESVRLSILGPVFALLLQQRGLLTLHASAVAMRNSGIAFLGSHGYGKSTMVATLQARGYPLVSDDLTAVTRDHRLVPSFPQIKLWPDAVGVLGHASDTLPLVHPDVDKRALRFEQGFARESVPLKRLYLLGKGPLAIEPVPARQALGEIMAHLFGSRFGPAWLKALDPKEHFLRVTSLVREVPVRRLKRPATLKEDPGLVEAIEQAVLEDLDSELES